MQLRLKEILILKARWVIKVYEGMTFEFILERMLDRIPDSMDKREGSVIYDALSPCALELAQAYSSIDMMADEFYADTASREMLIRRARERGLAPYPATAATIKGMFNMDIPLGARFSCDGIFYVAREKSGESEYLLECERLGVMGNKKTGELVPADYIEGLEKSEIKGLIIPGEEEEDTEVFRARYFESFESKAFGGNEQDYINRTNAISGVGATKVIPIWQGGGTVKLVILDSEMAPANESLVKKVQEAVDPSKDGRGKGLAPIDHVVTVAPAVGIPINVTSHISFEGGNDFTRLKPEIFKAVSGYLMELRKKWQENRENALTVRISHMNTRISLVKGVADIEGTLINGRAENLEIEPYSVPVDGEVVNNA